MKIFKNALVVSTVLITSISANAQCGPTAVDPQPQPVMICEGSDITITFTAAGTCTGNWEFQVSDGGGVVQAWSTTASYLAAPVVATTYTVEARCSACPATVVNNTFLVDVTTEPTVAGNLTLCEGEVTTLVASGSNGTMTWNDANGGQVSATDTYTTPALTTTTTYNVAAGSQTANTGVILITECGLEGAVGGSGSEDYIEVSNLYNTAVNTTGWVVVVSSSYTNINSFNTTLWNLPNQFTACSMVSRTDLNSAPNYWGNNIFWNSTSNSWAMIIDNVGNVVDFVAWGWSGADIAGFNATINGFPITLGAQWAGAGVPLPCSTTGGVPFAIQRVGNADTDTNGDWVCQASTPDILNPGLTCGWTASSCSWPVVVTVNSTPAPTVANATSCAGSPVTLTASAPGGTYEWYDAAAGGNLLFTGASFTTPGLTNSTSYWVQSTLNGCISPMTQVDVTINTLSIPNVITNATCFGNTDGSITVAPQGGTAPYTYAWSSGGTLSLENNIGAGSYTVTVTDNDGCTLDSTFTVTEPGPLNFVSFTADEPVGCVPLSVNFTNTTDPASVASSDWDFGDLNTGTGTNVNHIYTVPGSYDVTLTVTDPAGCVGVLSLASYVTVYELPTAAFSFAPEIATIFDPTVSFVDESVSNINGWDWDFAGFGSSTDQNPVYDMPADTGTYVVTLIVTNIHGCTDTVTNPVQVKGEFGIFCANSFTPDGDGINDLFGPEGFGISPEGYEFMVFDRWGELVFEADELTDKWNGIYNGAKCKTDTYAYIIKYQNESGQRGEKTGHVNLLR